MIGLEASYVLLWGLAGPIIFCLVGALMLLAKQPSEQDRIKCEKKLKGSFTGPGSRLLPVPVVKLRILGSIFLIVGLGFFLGGKNDWAQQSDFHSQLTHLDSAEVVDVQISHRLITDRDHIQEIVSALNQSEWFLSDHGGWSILVPLKIRLKSGSEFEYNVATYLKKNGVLIFKGNDTSARIEFSARLKNALKNAGLVLPVLEEDQSRYPH